MVMVVWGEKEEEFRHAAARHGALMATFTRKSAAQKE